MDKIRKLMRVFRKKEIILYVIFGGLTTLVNFVVYLASVYVGHVTAAAATAIAWVIAVLFAYITNRRYVFGCDGNIFSFFGTRICSGLVEVLLMAALVDGLQLEKLMTKLAVGVLVMAMNYLGSKALVFRSPKQTSGQSAVKRGPGRSAGSRVAL